jgi:hypothetical protein
MGDFNLVFGRFKLVRDSVVLHSVLIARQALKGLLIMFFFLASLICQ